jgi:hypothetical protein
MRHGCNYEIMRELISQDRNQHNIRLDKDAREKPLRTCQPER